MIVGLDTNLLVYATMSELAEHAAARDFLESRFRRGSDVAAVAPLLLQEYIHVVTDARRFERPLPMEAAIARARAIGTACESRLLDQPRSVTLRALELLRQHGLGRRRIHDATLVATLEAHDVATLATRDVTDFERFGLTVLNPLDAGSATS